MTIHEAESDHGCNAVSTCIEVEPVLQRLVGENIGKGWREVVRRRIGRWKAARILSELLGPAVTTLFQTMSMAAIRKAAISLENLEGTGKRVLHQWVSFLRTDGAHRRRQFPQFATRPAARD